MTTRELFRRTSEMFWNVPLLWTPVLLADACRYGIVVYAIKPLQRAVIYALLPKSVLGGYGGPATGTPMLPILASGLVQWVGYLICIALYLVALGVIARAVQAIQLDTAPRRAIAYSVPARIPSALGRVLLRLILVLVGLGVLAHSAMAIPNGIYILFGVGSLALAYLQVKPLRVFVAANQSGGEPPSAGTLHGFLLLLMAFALSNGLVFAWRYEFSNDAQLRNVSGRIFWAILPAAVSLVSSLPYAFAFIGLSLQEPLPGLFVYGTLHPERAPVEMRDVVARLSPLGEGTVVGRLLDLGEYPGLVLDGEVGAVAGEVFALPEDAAVLAALDAYEGFVPEDVAGSLFVRELLDVTIGDGRVEKHWVYVYNRGL